MLIVSVTNFEDLTSSSGEVVTVYIVKVQYSHSSSYLLSKRYSDFSDLYGIFKDTLPPQYKFPNKSIFSNGAQFTKERRIKGFDELLKILCGLDPFPTPLIQFLEMEERVSVGSRENFVFLAVPTTTPGPKTVHAVKPDPKKAAASFSSASSSAPSRIDRDKYPGLVNEKVVDNKFSFDNQHHADFDLEKEIDLKVKKDFPTIISSSFKVAAIAYILFIVLSIIDVSSTTLSQMIVTLLALGLLLTFIRIINFKIECRNTKKIAVD